jgi:molybdopterin-guanine dinucleotide biosynthesis protein A
LFPFDLAQRLLDTLISEEADIAVAAAKEEDGTVRAQPVFCLMRVNLLESLVKFMQSGGRKIDTWTALHKTVLVPFDTPDVDPRAFFNANTLEELHRLEQTT